MTRPLALLTRLTLCAALAGQSACLQKLALGAVADGLSGTGSTFASDPDPELVASAVPFALKTMEALMPQLPEHWPLRLAACSGFTQYAYAFVLTPAKLQGSVSAERTLAQRAKGLLLRARRYCLDAFDIKYPGFKNAVTVNKSTLGATTPVIAKLVKDDVPLLYWLAASTALTITSLKEQVDMLPELPVVDVLLKRAIALDPDWDRGSLQELLIAWDGGRSPAMGGSAERARAAFQRALSLSAGKRVGPYVSLAESVSVSEQNRKEFDALLKQAMAVDLEASPNDRLANTLARRRAERLQSQADELILGDAP